MAVFPSCRPPLLPAGPLTQRCLAPCLSADLLAQAFDSLCLDLKADEGKNLFLECQAVPVVLSHLKVSSKGLLSSAIDSLLQMTVESSECHIRPESVALRVRPWGLLHATCCAVESLVPPQPFVHISTNSAQFPGAPGCADSLCSVTPVLEPLSALCVPCRP